MLYTHAELQNTVHRKVALQRYLYKFANHRKEVKRLKLHEKEFMFRSMNAIIQVPEGLEGIELDFETDIEAYQYLEKNGLAKRAFNLYEIEEAHEYVFYKIVLTYYHNLNFLMPAHGPLGLLSKEEILVDKSFFEYYYPIWQKLDKPLQNDPPRPSETVPLCQRKLIPFGQSKVSPFRQAKVIP